jgi:DNA-binding transcriptional LysR family regulator
MAMAEPADLDSLRLLVRVDELGSVGQAARSMGISQPSASKRLATLERRAALALLVRTTRGSRLTADGRLVAAWAAQVLAAADQFGGNLRALRRDRLAELNVVASMTVSEALLPRWLHELRLREPDLRVALTVTNSAEVARLVLTDATISLGFVEGPTVPAGLTSRLVGHDELIVVVSPGHPWAGRTEPVTPPELAATPLVVREAGSGTRETLDRALDPLPRTAPHVALGSNAAVKGAAIAGEGAAVLSRYAVEVELAAGRLIAVPVATLSLHRTLRAVWPRSRRLPPTAQSLLRVALAAGPR